MSEDEVKGGEREPESEAPKAETPEPAPPEGEAVAPSPQRDRPDLEALRARREKAHRRRRRFWMFFGCSAALFLGAVLADWLLKGHYRDLYHRQPWIEIQQALKKVEGGKVLDIHLEKFRDRLDETYLGKEAYAIGRVTEVLPGDPLEVCIDVPHFLEMYDFHADDIHLEWKSPLPEGVAPSVWVLCRGRVKNFGDYRLRIVGISIRPLRFYELYYVRKTVPPTRLTRDGVDSRNLFK